jgi:flagellar protein FlaH
MSMGGTKSTSKDVYSISLESDELSEKMGGGLPKGSIVLIEGEEGSGRSVISQRLCYGLVSNDHSVTFISTESTMRNFIDQMYSLDYKIADHLPCRRLIFIPVYPLLGEAKPRGGFLSRLVNSPQLYTTDVIIIDTLSSLVGSDIRENSCLAFLSFLKKLTSMGKTIIMTAEKGQKDLEHLRLASDIYAVLNLKMSGDGMQRTLQIKRFSRARSKVDEIIGFRIEPKIGMVIEITEVSG